MRPLSKGPEEIKFLSRILRKVEFFTDLTVSELDQILDLIDLYECPQNTTIFKKGDAADSFYMVYQGKVDVIQPKWLFLKKKMMTLGEGDFFGEMALAFKTKRTATIKTAEPTKIFVLMAHDFENVMNENPFFSKAINRIANKRKFVSDRLVA